MTPSVPRRVLLVTSAAASAVIGPPAHARTLVDRKDARALDDVADAERVDRTDSPKFAAGRNHTRRALDQGNPTDKAADGPVWTGKRVADVGWCSAWAGEA